MKKRKIRNDTFISVFIDVASWKKKRVNLIKGILSDSNEISEWESAFKLLNDRITTRYLNPINLILNELNNVGEGFSVVALQCILIEFLEAFYQGKIYTTSRSHRDFEYHSSRKLFRDFLMGHKPFSDCFKTKANANGFFDNVRCGLLHEAATKQTSRINNAQNHDMIVRFERDDPSNMRIYRENFQDKIEQYIDAYKRELLANENLQINFIRKMDDICGIRHNYYFAYGSNMYPKRLLDRINKYHKAFSALLEDHKFIYNKKSVDGTAKANLEPSVGDRVYGVCYEIDEDDFSVLHKYEGGYDRRDISLTVDGNKKSKSVTYISAAIDVTLLPSDEYKNLILEGANHWNLPKDYVSQYLL